MLFVYGPYLPYRWLEEVKGWKEEERLAADAIRRQASGLPPFADRLLAEWAAVFEGTARCAGYWQRVWTETPAGLPAEAEPHVLALLQAARAQSEAFARQLDDLASSSRNDRRDETAERLAQAAAASRAHTERLARLMPDGLRNDGTRNGGGDAPAPLPENRNGGSGTDGRVLPSWSDPVPESMPAAAVVPIGGHTLPPLPYGYHALEPYIDEETMRLHHDKHHQSYVDGLNKAELALQAARAAGDFGLVKHWERELAFHGAGHYLHTIFWRAMSPKGGGTPEGRLLGAIIGSFGSFEAFKRQFSAAAEQVEGGGWAILVYSPRSRRLEILQAEKHQNLSQWDAVPLLPLDVWEHAYYLKYRNRRADYIANWWNVVNWPYVAERYEAASRLQWEPRLDERIAAD